MNDERFARSVVLNIRQEHKDFATAVTPLSVEIISDICRKDAILPASNAAEVLRNANNALPLMNLPETACLDCQFLETPLYLRLRAVGKVQHAQPFGDA